MRYLLFLPLLFSTVFGQQILQIVSLDPSLSESSGVLFLNQKIITHNDSQGAAALFEVDSVTGQISRTVIVANATNKDWEDLAYDDTYIYIGDFGNNSGDRTDLKIYRISQNDYWNTPNDTVIADTIRLSYFEQTDFSPQPNATNWDCEAMTVIGDSIYLFTKNWINLKTYVYVCPKSIGNFALTMRDSLPIQGLVTSADFNIHSNRLVLVGYNPLVPFVVEMDWNASIPISQISRNRYAISVPNSIQVESIVAISANQYYLTSEYFFGSSGNLMRLNGKNGSLNSEETPYTNPFIFPQPTADEFTIQFSKNEPVIRISMFNLNGQMAHEVDYKNESKIEISAPKKKGIYFVRITTQAGTSIEKVIVE